MHLVRFLQRSRPPLKHLILDEIDCFHVALLDALALTPHLQGLWLENCIFDDTILKGLHDSGAGFTSSLATLVLVSCYAIDVLVLADILTDVKARRQAENRQCLTAYVDDCGMMTKEQVEKLKEMDVIEFGKYIPLEFVDSAPDSHAGPESP